MVQRRCADNSYACISEQKAKGAGNMKQILT